ncbi:MAG: ABC transporter substrate-binding protein [Chloroflexota bacterium]|nr:ABC transporter substrate-binding protein [Chloroflexota bacterium]
MSGSDANTEKNRTVYLRLDSNTSRRDFLKKAAAAGLAGSAVVSGVHRTGASQTGATPSPMASPLASSQASPVTQAGPGQPGGEFVVLGHQEVSSLSPEDADATVHWAVVTQMHDGLYQYDENYEIQPVLADSYELSPDGRTYTFRLKQGVTFHNGDPFSSADVKYTYDWIMNPDNASTRAGSFELVESVEAPDPTTVVVTTTEPTATFMSSVAPTMIFPARYHAEVGEEAYKAAPVGTGPFKLREWNAAQRTVLERNDTYFRGRPYFDVYRLDVVPEAGGRMAALQTGAADTSIWPLNAEDNVTLVESGQFTSYEWLQSAVNHFPLNNTHPALSDKQVRKAMMHAINRQAIIDDIFQGQSVLATSNLTPANQTYYTDQVTQYDYNVETANQLLDQAGWAMGGDGIREKDGQKLSFTCVTITGDTTRRPEAEIVQQWLIEVGIDMQLQEAPVTTILEQMRAGEMDAALFNWVYGDALEPDARETLSTDGANNFTQFSNARVDELLQAGVRELDEQARIPIYHEIQQIVAEEVPFLFIMHLSAFTFYNNRIQGLPESAVSGDALLQKAYQYWIEE